MGPTNAAWRELAVPGAWEITPTVFGDSRGGLFEWFTEQNFADMTGHRFEMRQANCSVSEAIGSQFLLQERPNRLGVYIDCALLSL